MTSFFGKLRANAVSSSHIFGAASTSGSLVERAKGSAYKSKNTDADLCAFETGNSPATGSSAAKKDPNQPPPTPLEKLLQDAGPIRNDGSDKFYGMENVRSSAACRGDPMLTTYP